MIPGTAQISYECIETLYNIVFWLYFAAKTSSEDFSPAHWTTVCHTWLNAASGVPEWEWINMPQAWHVHWLWLINSLNTVTPIPSVNMPLNTCVNCKLTQIMSLYITEIRCSVLHAVIHTVITLKSKIAAPVTLKLLNQMQLQWHRKPRASEVRPPLLNAAHHPADMVDVAVGVMYLSHAPGACVLSTNDAWLIIRIRWCTPVWNVDGCLAWSPN